MSLTPAIDLSRLPPPDVVESLNYEAILAEILTRLEGAVPGYVVSEADPAYKILEIVAYDKLLDRQRVNDAALPGLLGNN